MSIVLGDSIGAKVFCLQWISISTGFFGGMMQCTGHQFTSSQSYPAGLSSTTPATRTVAASMLWHALQVLHMSNLPTKPSAEVSHRSHVGQGEFPLSHVVTLGLFILHLYS